MLVKVLAIASADHLAYAQLQILFLVVKSAAELVGLFLAGGMKVKAHVRLEANAKVVVHHIDLGVVLVRVGLVHVDRNRELTLHVVELLVLVGMEHDRPPVQYDLLGLDDVAQQIDGVLGARVAGAPAQHARQIVARAQRHDRHRR